MSPVCSISISKSAGLIYNWQNLGTAQITAGSWTSGPPVSVGEVNALQSGRIVVPDLGASYDVMVQPQMEFWIYRTAGQYGEICRLVKAANASSFPNQGALIALNSAGCLQTGSTYDGIGWTDTVAIPVGVWTHVIWGLARTYGDTYIWKNGVQTSGYTYYRANFGMSFRQIIVGSSFTGKLASIRFHSSWMANPADHYSKGPSVYYTDAVANLPLQEGSGSSTATTKLIS